MISGFDSKLVTLIESHPSIIVGTCDRALVPCIARAFGARVSSADSSIEILVSRWPGPQTQQNLEQTDRVAVTFTTPETFEAFQVKGRASVLGECDAQDLALSNAYTEVIRTRIASLNEPTDLVKAIFTSKGLFKIKVTPDSVYLQTPGKNAGQRI
jgi:hypothetical protein